MFPSLSGILKTINSSFASAKDITSAILSSAVDFYGYDEPENSPTIDIDEKKLASRLKDLSYTTKDAREVTFSDLGAEETMEGRLWARNLFQTEMGTEIFKLKLNEEKTNALLELLAQDDYTKLLSQLAAFAPPLPKEFIQYTKEQIIKTEKDQTEYEKILKETKALTAHLEEVAATQKELEKTTAENAKLKQETQEKDDEIAKLKQALAKAHEEALTRLASEATSVVGKPSSASTAPESTDIQSEGVVPPPPPPPPPASYLTPPKPKLMDPEIMKAFGGVLGELRQGKTLKKTAGPAEKENQPEPKKAPLSFLEQFRREKAKKASQVTTPAMVEPPEVRGVSVRINLTKGRIAGAQATIEKHKKNIDGLETTIKKTRSHHPKNRRKVSHNTTRWCYR